MSLPQLNIDNIARSSIEPIETFLERSEDGMDKA